MLVHGIIPHFGLIFLLFATFAKCKKLHELFTDDEFFRVFRTSRDNVPEYDIVPIMHDLYKRSATSFRIKFNAFGNEVETFLNPTDGVLAGENTPIWRSFTYADGRIGYARLPEGIVGLAAKSYESFTDLASIIVTKEDNGNKLSFQGSFDDDSLRVVPLPERIQEESLDFNSRRKREISKTSRTMIASDYHVIIRTKAMTKNSFENLRRKVVELSDLHNETDGTRLKRSSKEIIYPSLLITTDYKDGNTANDEFAFQNDIIYQLTFWNSVDLRFRHLVDPKVRLNIAGIIIGQGRSATPWIKNHTTNGVIDVKSAWLEMQKYWFDQRNHPDFGLDSYNVVATITDVDMMNVKDDGTKENVLGWATVGGLCSSTNSQRMWSNFIIVDHRGFDGVRTAAHEIGHILGATHDGEDPVDCAKSLGYMMAPTADITENALKWSRCSMTKISKFLRYSHVNCADDPVNLHGDPIERILPGIIVDDHHQCQAQGYYYACDPSPEICKKLRCSYSGFHKFFTGCYDAYPAADGTKCDTNAVCIDGECIIYHGLPILNE